MKTRVKNGDNLQRGDGKNSIEAWEMTNNTWQQDARENTIKVQMKSGDMCQRSNHKR